MDPHHPLDPQQPLDPKQPLDPQQNMDPQQATCATSPGGHDNEEDNFIELNEHGGFYDGSGLYYDAEGNAYPPSGYELRHDENGNVFLLESDIEPQEHQEAHQQVAPYVEAFTEMQPPRVVPIDIEEDLPAAVRTKGLKEKSKTKSIEKAVNMFKELITVVCDTDKYDEGVRTIIVNHIKDLLTGLIDAELFTVRMKQFLGNENHPFAGPPRKNVTFLYRAVPLVRIIMQEKDLIVDGFNINEELGVFVHTFDIYGQPIVILTCEGKIQKR